MDIEKISYTPEMVDGLHQSVMLYKSFARSGEEGNRFY